MPEDEPRRELDHATAEGGLLAPLRQHWRWTMLGLLVAGLAAGTRFVAIGVVPPSIKMKPFAHATASTELVVGRSAAFTHSVAGVNDPYILTFSSRTYALADMLSSPELANYVARAAGLPVTKIGIMGPLWTELQRQQQWATGPKRASQIIIENRPYHITISAKSQEAPWAAVIDVATQAPTTGIAARLATGVAAGLSAYVVHLQTATGVPKRERYDVRQLAPVSVLPPRTSQLANVGAFTFAAVFVIWCGVMIAVSSLLKDLRSLTAVSKVGDHVDRSSSGRSILTGTE
jgi:hypothetical protein